MGRIDSIIDGVIAREGAKFTNDPKDSGGPTKYGVTQRALAAYLGKPVSAADVAAMTEALARAVYRHSYVDEPGYAALVPISEAIAGEVVDTGVNTGTARATLMLQQALNGLNRNARDYADVPEDGKCGPGTARALAAFKAKRGKEGETVLLRALNCLQGAFYIELARGRPKDEEYLYGWLRERVAA